MIQFNLLPDVKLQYLKAEHMRRLATSISILVTIVSLVILGLLFGVVQLQKKHLSDLSRDIKKESSQLEGQSDLNKILTVQNQLASLTALHNQKPAANRLFNYLAQIVPNKVNANSLNVDFTQNTATITGTTDSISTVNKFVDTLKFTHFKVSGSSDASPAFSDVVLSSFSLGQDGATYTVTFNFDPALFDITQQVTLSVPNLITTRSELDKPSDLFVLPANNTSTDTNNNGAGQ